MKLLQSFKILQNLAADLGPVLALFKAIFLILFKKQPSLLLNGEVMWQCIDSSLFKDSMNEQII